MSKLSHVKFSDRKRLHAACSEIEIFCLAIQYYYLIVVRHDSLDKVSIISQPHIREQNG
jgi:hypothetical protein